MSPSKVSHKPEKGQIRRYIGWSEIVSGVEILRSIIQQRVDTTRIAGVCGIPRGGLIPAVMLSHCLNLPLVDIAEVEGNSDEPGREYVVVDDIADSGESIAYAMTPRRICGVLYKRFSCSTFVSQHIVCAYTVDNNDWIVFPWELGHVT